MIPGLNPSNPLRCLREYCDEDLITERRDILASLERRERAIRHVLERGIDAFDAGLAGKEHFPPDASDLADTIRRALAILEHGAL